MYVLDRLTAPSRSAPASPVGGELYYNNTDGNIYVWDAVASGWVDMTVQLPDASTSVKGVTKLSVAPVTGTNPIAVGDNDTRVVADQVAGTASIRTLGTGAQQAAAGNHLHTGVYQPLDATLTSLAAYNTNGILAQTAADTFAGRTITGTAGQITVTNGSGVSGDPTISLPATITQATTFTTDLTAQTAVTIPTGFVSSFIALDTTAMAANVGGSIEFRGKYTAAGGLADYAAISGVKANATDGNIDGLLRFFVRANAGALVERANLDTSGNLSVTGQYRIGGTQISASNLSNGVTGSGAVVLATSPTIAGFLTFNGTLRGQASGSGAIQLQPGTSTNPGYVEWVNSSGTRMGYMGFDTTHLTLMIEQAGTFQVGRGTAVTRSADTPLFSVLWPNSQTYSANLASTEGSYFAQPTYAGDVAGRTITSAGTVVIQGAPVAGTNMTITNAYALLVQAGAAVFAGNASVGGSGQAVGFFGATPGAKRVSYGSGTQIGTYTTLSAASTLNDVIAAVSKLIADLRDGYGLVGA